MLQKRVHVTRVTSNSKSLLSVYRQTLKFQEIFKLLRTLHLNQQYKVMMMLMMIMELKKMKLLPDYALNINKT